MQLQLEIFLFFFRVGPPGLLIMGGPARTPHEVAASCQVIYFYFYLASGILWVIYSGETSKADASAPGLLSWSIDDVSSDNRYSMDHNKRRNYGHNTIKKNSRRPGRDPTAGEAGPRKVSED